MAKKKNRKPASKNEASTPPPQPPNKSSSRFYLVVGGLAAAGVAALFLLGRGGAPAAQPLSLAQTSAEPSAAAGVSMGPQSAPVRIVEFADFLCPACRNFNAVTGKLIRQTYAQGEDAVLQWVNYDFPLHQESWQPALAARCAEPHGMYWQMHDLIYARSDDWRSRSNPNGFFMDMAEDLGIDRSAYRSCLEDPAGLEHIGAARKYGESLGVNATPTLFINGQQIPSQRRYYSYEGMSELIQQAAAQARDAEGEATESAESDGDDAAG